ncbi:MAG: F0F1 ATP synthase subunit gamma [Acidocella sp.]|nr:F0F1 ATP synthase subunit gamma [Acidocella sp.]
MTGRLAEVSGRIENIRQLGAVVNAMRGIAGARAQAARAQLEAVERYTATIATAIGTLLAAAAPAPIGAQKPAQLLFCAEQGFAGAFSEHVLDHAAPEAALFLLGTRGGMLAAERGLMPVWSHTLPAASAGVPRLARQVATELYARIEAEGIDRIDALYQRWHPGTGLQTEHRRLLPLDPADFSAVALRNPPLLNLPPGALLASLTADYVHAMLCQAALHSFVAENEARMATMAAAHRHIDQQLQSLELMRRIVRQDEITAEIIELAAGQAANGVPPAA